MFERRSIKRKYAHILLLPFQGWGRMGILAGQLCPYIPEWTSIDPQRSPSPLLSTPSAAVTAMSILLAPTEMSNRALMRCVPLASHAKRSFSPPKLRREAWVMKPQRYLNVNLGFMAREPRNLHGTHPVRHSYFLTASI